MKYDNHFKLYSYGEALTHSIVINKNKLEYNMWFELPHHTAKYLSLYEIVEVTSDLKPTEVDFIGKLKREHRKPWLCAETTLFNTDAGYHMYKFMFYNHEMDTTISLYFAYRIQDDNPDKSSYVYMKRG